MPLVAPVMKAVVTWAFLIAWFQCAARTDAAKPRKPAKRKDKLSNFLFPHETWIGILLNASAANQWKKRENEALRSPEMVVAGRRNKKHGFRNAWL